MTTTEKDPIALVLEGQRFAFVAQGDCRKRLKELPDNSVDAVVTDPPAGIEFMGKDWDSFGKKAAHFSPKRSGRGLPRYGTWRPSATEEAINEQRDTKLAFQNFIAEVFEEVYRVLKPGGHALVWAIPRTAHHTTMGVERAGFEIRDVVHHLFGTGFPKSLDVSKVLDRMAGVERKVIGTSSDEAKKWSGWGTALKPAAENWILARKPLIGTVAANVLEHGTGALNIDGCRVSTAENLNSGAYSGGTRNPVSGDDRSAAAAGMYGEGGRLSPEAFTPPAGRWPANFVLSHSDGCVQTGTKRVKASVDGKEEVETWDCVPECAVRALDNQSGEVGNGWKRNYGDDDYKGKQYKGDSGGASRFFYVAKAPGAEKSAVMTCGCTPKLKIKDIPVISMKEAKAQTGQPCPVCGETRLLHAHPTVKSISLMEWLVKLVTPPGGVVLDPFTGSGSTGVAARKLGFRFIGMEQDKVYCALARHRVKNAVAEDET